MEKYTSKAAIILFINTLICFTLGLHQLEVINFVLDSYYFTIPVYLLFTFAIWNTLMVFDKKNEKNTIHSLFKVSKVPKGESIGWTPISTEKP